MNITLTICSAIMFLAYNIVSFIYANKVLLNPYKKASLYILFSLVNLGIFKTMLLLQIPYYYYYVIGMIVITIEFMAISKATFRQAIFGSSAFFMHISSSHLLVVTVIAVMENIKPYDVFKIQDYFSYSTTITFLVLLLILIIVQKLIPFDDIKKISSTPRYSEMLSMINIFIVLYTSFDAYLLISDELFIELIIIVASTVIMSAILFYVVFIYTIHLVNMNLYKSKTEDIEYEYNKLLNEKVIIEQKIIKDGLTQLYNRKFIYNVLKQLCEKGNSTFGILFIDIDGLKYVNDTLGHKEGDVYIKNICSSIKDGLRDNDLPARIGGDEFIVILQDIVK